MLDDVSTWVMHEGELYVLIIIIHGMLRNFVNMKCMLELENPKNPWPTNICEHKKKFDRIK